LQSAQWLASCFDNQQVDVEHLLLALLDQEHGLASAILNKANISVEGIKVRLHREIERLPKVKGAPHSADQFYVTARLRALLTRQAEAETKQFKDDYISVEHLLLAMTEDTGTAGQIFKEFGATRERLMQALQDVRGHQRVTTPNPESTYQALERYGR